MTHKIVFTGRNTAEASAVHQWLAEAGIESSVQNSEFQSGTFDLGPDPDPQVVVAESDFDAAREIVSQFEEELNKTVDMSELSDEDGQFDWPACPICDELRYATCAECGHNGSEFAHSESDDSQLVCQTCGKPTPADLQDSCKFCGHDFTQSANSVDASADLVGANVNRVAFVIGSMVVLFIILLTWLFLS